MSNNSRSNLTHSKRKHKIASNTATLTLAPASGPDPSSSLPIMDLRRQPKRSHHHKPAFRGYIFRTFRTRILHKKSANLPLHNSPLRTDRSKSDVCLSQFSNQNHLGTQELKLVCLPCREKKRQRRNAIGTWTTVKLPKGRSRKQSSLSCCALAHTCNTCSSAREHYVASSNICVRRRTRQHTGTGNISRRFGSSETDSPVACSAERAELQNGQQAAKLAEQSLKDFGGQVTCILELTIAGQLKPDTTCGHGFFSRLRGDVGDIQAPHSEDKHFVQPAAQDAQPAQLIEKQAQRDSDTSDQPRATCGTSATTSSDQLMQLTQRGLLSIASEDKAGGIMAPMQAHFQAGSLNALSQGASAKAGAVSPEALIVQQLVRSKTTIIGDCT